MSDQDSQIELEIKITYLEETIGELNKLAYRQQKTIDKLTAEVTEIKDKLDDVEEKVKTDLPHEKPPHY